MEGLTFINLLVAFAAGVLSFLSPCMLPLVPGYIAVLGSDASSPRSRMQGAVLFVVGFGVVFVALGVGSSIAGGTIVQARRPIEIVGGAVIATFGLAMLLEHRMPMILQRRIGRELKAPEPGRFGAFGFGVIFGAAWSPCIGPTLGAILTLAAANGSALGGAILLTVFAAGLGIPFLLLAAGVSWLDSSLGFLKRHSRGVRTLSGVLLLVFGVSLALGLAGQASSRLSGIPGLDI